MKDKKNIFLSLVIPVYNEETIVTTFIDKISKVFSGRDDIKIEMVFVNDGGTDSTLEVLQGVLKTDSRITIIELTRNFGKEAALSAGLKHANGDVIIPIDVDLQDPPELIDEMIAKWREGYDVVQGKRVSRKSDNLAKRTTAKLFYKFFNWISPLKLEEDVGDFRLMDRKVVEAINELPESCRFMKGLFAWVGFRSCQVEYIRPERTGGTTKFSLWKLWNFALDGITGFTTIPLRCWTYVGISISIIAFIRGMYITLRTLVFGIDLPGYASLTAAITFLGGVQLIGIGVIGEYLGRTYIESKNRPIYLVRQVYKTEEEVTERGRKDTSSR